MTSVPHTLPARSAGGRVTAPRVALSEWTKLRSVRSTLWSLLAAVVMTIGFPVLFAFIVRSHWSSMNPGERAHRQPLDVALAGVNVSQLAIAVLGVLVITAEYSTGMIRASFTAVPRRLPVLGAKTLVFAVVTFALILPSVLVAFFASQSILGTRHILQVSFSSPGIARALVGGALYVTVVGVFALGLGALIRNTAGGIATFVGIMFVIPPLMNVLPASWNDAITPYLPSSAGRDVFALVPDAHALGPWTGFALFCGYALATLAVAAVLMVRRDT